MSDFQNYLKNLQSGKIDVREQRLLSYKSISELLKTYLDKEELDNFLNTYNKKEKNEFLKIGKDFFINNQTNHFLLKNKKEALYLIYEILKKEELGSDNILLLNYPMYLTDYYEANDFIIEMNHRLSSTENNKILIVDNIPLVSNFSEQDKKVEYANQTIINYIIANPNMKIFYLNNLGNRNISIFPQKIQKELNIKFSPINI